MTEADRDALRAIAYMDCYTREGEELPHLIMMRIAKEALSALPAPEPVAGEEEQYAREADWRARFVRLDECPVGLFWGGSVLCNKTEYRTDCGAIEAHIVGSGEFFWGEKPQTAESQCGSQVVPIDIEFAERVLDVTLDEQTTTLQSPTPDSQFPVADPELIARVEHVANATGKERWKIANLTGYDWRRILAALRASPPNGEEN